MNRVIPPPHPRRTRAAGRRSSGQPATAGRMPPLAVVIPSLVLLLIAALLPAAADTGADTARPYGDADDDGRHWAYQPPVPTALPPVSDPGWPRQPSDHFILAALEAAELDPSPDANPAVLLRRVHFDLVGLPPDAGQTEAFIQAADQHGIDQALAEVVDELLQSPHFGERWGRHWLDVARYAESSGMESNMTFPQAWRYRDYVIRSFNDDLPFDSFIHEQLAGDLLPWQDDDERARLLIATGFLAIGPKGLGEQNLFQFWADVIDEQIDAFSQAFTATTLACARCHDHFSEPYGMDDYYAVAGIFASTDTRFGSSIGPGSQVASDFLVLPEIDGQWIPNQGIPAARVRALEQEREDLERQQKTLRAAAAEALREGRDPSEEMTLQQAISILWSLGRINGRLKTVDDQGRPLPLAMGVLERDRMIDVPLLDRGEIGRPGDQVPRGLPKVTAIDGIPSIPDDQSGRLQLAQWLTHPDHPQTSRVMVNRLWRHLFGAGLVATTDNFGAEGERPSHPELLDHLALRFIELDWSVKAMVRELVLSRAYRQASHWREQAFLTDPDNRLLWRASKRRLDAEAIRDAMLWVAGELDPEPPRGSLVADLGERSVSIIGFARGVSPDLDGSLHRSVYLPVMRDRLPDVLDLFDFAEPSYVTGDRDTTNVPLQALYLLNSDFVMQRADALAARVLDAIDGGSGNGGDGPEDAGAAAAERAIAPAFAMAHGRRPDPEEEQIAAAFMRRLAADDSLTLEQTIAAYCQSLLASAEFRHLD